jgi:hypothetical protein
VTDDYERRTHELHVMIDLSKNRLHVIEEFGIVMIMVMMICYA